jgi:hypothetical protein
LPGPKAISTGGAVPFEISWTLLKQSDGSYAFQTSSGGILTANEGGLAGGFRTDTETDQIENWQKFTLIDNGDCTYYIKTYSGKYLKATNAPPDSPIDTVLDISQANKWRFWVFSL